MKPYKEIKLCQGSEDWHLYRRSHLMATDSAKILGINPWSSALDCYNEKIRGAETICTPAMQRGIELEPKARELVNKLYTLELKPKVFESIKYPWMGASLDAISDDCKTLFEIKCPGDKAMIKAFNNEIEPTYIMQCNKQMLVMGLEKMILLYYFNDVIYHEVPIYRDEERIKRIIKAETNFWKKNLLPQIPPEKYGDEYERIKDKEANKLAMRWQELTAIEKEAKEKKEKVVVELEQYTKGKSCIFSDAGLRHQVIEKKGSIDWSQVKLSYSIKEKELEAFRKEKSSFSKFSDI